MGAIHYDVVVVGGGHNGAIAALTLRLHGLDVAVVEQNNLLGGLSGARYVFGLPSSRFAYVIGLVPRELHEWLEILPRLVYPEPNWVELDVDDNIVFRWWMRREKLVKEFKELGVDIRLFLEELDAFWKCYKKLGLYFTAIAPNRDKAAQQLDSCNLSHIVASSVQKLLMDNDVPRSYWDYFVYPSMLGSSGFVLAYYMQNNNIWGIPYSSMTSFSKSLARRLREEGIDTITGVRAESLILEDGRVRGVRLGDGRVVRARVVLFSAPITSLLDVEGYELLEEHEIRRLNLLRRSTTLRSNVKRIDYVFSEKPKPPREPGWRGTPLYVKWGRSSGGEYVFLEQHKGMYVVQFSGIANDIEEAFPPGGDRRVLVGYESRDRRVQVLCCRNYTGHPDHLPMIDEVLFDKRPVPGWNDYRSSLPCLYHGSASSYPGGEVNGVAGFNAALRILLDLGIVPRAPFIEKPWLREWLSYSPVSKWGVRC